MSSEPDSLRADPVCPPGWTWVRELASGSQGRVAQVRRGDEWGVLRTTPRAPGRAGPDPEFAILAQVQHAGLAALLDHGVLPGTNLHFTVRSWIEGQDLGREGERLRTSGPDGQRAIGRIVARLCAALSHLHRAGFVHADLKPTNVILGPDGAPVLTDFGLARASASSLSTISGSLFALAPEVLLGARIDGRADLFALGVLLHELLLARRVPAREFYARFPEQDYFTATG